MRISELAEALDLEWHGDDDCEIRGVATLTSAGPDNLTFLANPRYRDQLATTRAGAVILPPEAVEICPAAALVSTNPYASWARALALLRPERDRPAGIHPSASIADSAEIDPTARVEAQAAIGPGCRIGPGATIGPGSVLDNDVEIGADCRLIARVYLGPGVRLGSRVIVHPGAVIGADGFGLAMDSGRWLKVPQVGSVRIGDDCEIGANTTIDRGAVEDTVLEEDVRLDNQVQIAHNVQIGAHTAIAGCVGIAGSTRIGRYCMIAGACGIAGHLEICDRVVITAMSTVLDSITEPGQYGSGVPARGQRPWQRLLVRLGQLDQLFGRVRALERTGSSRDNNQ